MSLPALIRKTVPKVNPQSGKQIYDPATQKPVTQQVIYVNPAKRYVTPYWLTTDPDRVVVPGNGNSGKIPMKIDQFPGHFEMFYFLAMSEGPFAFKIYDEGNRVQLSNRAVHANTVTGNARQPFILPETYFINVARGSHTLTVVFYDLSGQENTIQFVAVGRRFNYKEAPTDIFKDFFEYYGDMERSNLFMLTTTEPIASLAAGASVDLEFRVTSDSFFEVMKLTAASYPENVNFETELAEMGSGRRFAPEGAFVDGSLQWGNGNFPHILPESYLFERDYRITGQITNLDAQQEADFYLTMTGRRIKYPEQISR